MARQRFRNGVTEQDRGTGKREQRQCMAEPPSQAVLDDIKNFAAASCDRGDRRDMIGLERMLHAKQKTQAQNSEHLTHLLQVDTSVPVLTFVSFCGTFFTNVRTKGTLARYDSSAVLDLTFAWGTRRYTEANVKSTALVSQF